MSTSSLYSLSNGSPEEIVDPILAELYGYWAGLRKAGSIPLRRDMDPVDIPRLLPYVILAEHSDSGRRIRFRLTGSDIAFAPGSDLTGRYLHERASMTPYQEHLCELYRLGAISNEGLYSTFSYGYSVDNGPKQVSRMFLPLRGSDSTPPMLLVGQVRDKSVLTAQPIWLTEPDHIVPIALFAIDGNAAPDKRTASQ